MKIIYSCYGGAHSSVVAASIHMGYLPIDRIPTKKEILSIPYYDQSPKEFRGTPIYMGKDDQLREVYVVGMGPYRTEYTEIAYNFAFQINNEVKKNIRIVNVVPLLNFSVRLGGFLSRRIGLIQIGRPLTAMGIQKNYHLFLQLVNNVKRTC